MRAPAPPVDFQRVFESLPAPVLLLEADAPRFTIAWANDAYLRATLTDRPGIVGRGLFEVFPDNPADPHARGVHNLRASLARVVATGAPDVMAIQKYDVRRPEHVGGGFEERYWTPVNVPVLSVAGELRWIVHRVENVTAFVRRSQELRERASASELEILARTRELQDANRQLQLLNDELEAFSYSVSHDLRAPIRHILGFMELLLRTAAARLDAKELRYAETIRGSAERAGRLVDDLLSFARMARADVSPAVVDVGALVDEVRATLAPEGHAAQARWKVGPLPVVRADREMLRIVFTNLLANAAKYARNRSPPVIEVGCTPRPDGGVAFSVTDNGVGFDMAAADKLFGVFQRLHPATEFEGVGIGLATVRRIVVRHGGDVWAEGEPGRGATFAFSLPASSVLPGGAADAREPPRAEPEAVT